MNHRIIAVLFSVLMATAAHAQTPERMQYQGFLTDLDGTPVQCPSADDCPAGPFDMTLRLYDVATEGVAIWEEEHPGVSISDGVFTLTLGANEPLDVANLPADLWLGLSINDTPEALPRQEVVSAAFALRASEAGIAQDADALGGLPADSYATKDELPGLCVTQEALTETLANEPPDYTNADVEVVLVDGAYVQLADLAAVAITGSYLDLSDTPEVLSQLAVNEAGDLTFAGTPILNSTGEWIGAPTGLQGPQGAPGIQGEPGIQGQPGVAGVPGQDGEDGEDGEDGVSVLSTVVDGEGKLVITLSNGTVYTSSSLTGPPGQTGEPGQPGTPGSVGSPGSSGTNSLTVVLNESAGANCTHGGAQIQAGQDLNSNGTLQANEVTSAQYVCNGAAGADGEGGDGGDPPGPEENYGLPAFAPAPPELCDVSLMDGIYFDNTLGNYRTCNGQVWAPQSDSCGNGVVDTGELCDDGDSYLGDLCSSCTPTSTLTCSQSCNGTGGVTGTGIKTVSAADGVPGDQFGDALALEGDTLVVGASRASQNNMNHVGAVYVYERNGLDWSQQQKIIHPDDPGADDLFGFSVALSGDTLAIGSPFEEVEYDCSDYDPFEDICPETLNNTGAIYVYTRTAGTWNLQQKIVAQYGKEGDHFGRLIELEGNTLVVGVPYKDKGDHYQNGAVYIFTRNGNVWSESQALDPQQNLSYLNFGYSLALDGNTLAVGTFQNDNRVRVFQRDGFGQWNLQDLFKPEDMADGDYLGHGLALSGNTLAVSRETPEAAVYIFKREGNEWTEHQKISSLGAYYTNFFGQSMAMTASRLMVGAYGDDTAGDSSGTIHLYTLQGDSWVEEALPDPVPSTAGDDCGYAVAIDNGTYALGCRDGDGVDDDTGTAVIYQESALCTPEGNCICAFGYGGADCSTLLNAQ